MGLCLPPDHSPENSHTAVTDWFKHNPLTGGLAAVALVLALAGLYFAYSQNAAFVGQADAFNANTAALQQLQSASPFPDGENLKAAEAEAAKAAEILAGLATEVAGQTAAADPGLTPRDFQDKLSSAVAAAEEMAAARKVSLPAEFYLGFADYKAQPPSESAAPMLGRQLESIANVTKLLLESGVERLVAVRRTPLPSEKDAQPGENGEAGLRLDPFDVEFVAEPAAFRTALSAIVAGRPIVMVRLVSVANSNPKPPAKDSADAGRESAEPPAAGQTTTGIPVVFGKESLSVKLRLAAVSLPPAAAEE